MSDPVDNNHGHEYNIRDKQTIIDRIKALTITLSKITGNNIRVEVDANGKVESAKARVTEFL